LGSKRGVYHLSQTFPFTVLVVASNLELELLEAWKDMHHYKQILKSVFSLDAFYHLYTYTLSCFIVRCAFAPTPVYRPCAASASL